MNKSRHKIDDILNDRLGEFRAETGPADWAAVASGLDRSRKRRDFLSRRYLLSVLTLFIGIGLGAGTSAYYFSKDPGTSAPLTPTVQSESSGTSQTDFTKNTSPKVSYSIFSGGVSPHPQPLSLKSGDENYFGDEKNSPIRKERGWGEVVPSHNQTKESDFQPGNRGMRQPGSYARHSHAGPALRNGNLGGPAAAGRGITSSTAPAVESSYTVPASEKEIAQAKKIPSRNSLLLSRIPFKTDLTALNRQLNRSTPRTNRKSGSGSSSPRISGPFSLKIGAGFSFSSQSLRVAAPDSVLIHPEYASLRRQNEHNGNSWQAHAEISWHPGRNLGFGAGLGIQHIERAASFRYASRYAPTYDSTGNQLTGYIQTESPTDTINCQYSQQYTWISLPLSLKYSIPLSRRMELEAHAGFTISYLLSAKGEEPGLQLLAPQRLPALKGFNTGLQLGGTAYYSVGRRSRIFLEASYLMLGPQPKTLSGVTQRLTNIPVSAGIQFRL